MSVSKKKKGFVSSRIQFGVGNISPRSPLERSGRQFSTDYIDFCTLLEKIPADGEVGVDSSPMEGRYILWVTLVR
jgi:hypothetical protein